MFFRQKMSIFLKTGHACLTPLSLAFGSNRRIKVDGVELKVRDSDKMKVDGQNQLILDDRKRQKVDGLKISLHYLLSLFELSA